MRPDTRKARSPLGLLYHNMALHNVAAVLPAEKGRGVRLSRLPDALRKVVNEGAARAALHAAGCEMRFNLKPGDTVELALQMDKSRFSWERGGLVEVFQGPFQTAWYFIGPRPTTITVSLPANLDALKAIGRRTPLLFDPALTRVVLPYRPTLRLLSIKGKCLPPKPKQVPRHRLLIYGTSLTHGAWSVHPSETYAMRLAHGLGMDLINLGFGGSCKYEPEFAEHIIARHDWDMAVIESHNMTGTEPPAFRAQYARFMRILADAERRKPIFCTNLFMLSETMPEVAKGGSRHNDLRAAARSVVRELNRPNITWLPTRLLFRDVTGLTADLVHPSPAGMEEIASNMIRKIRYAAGE